MPNSDARDERRGNTSRSVAYREAGDARRLDRQEAQHARREIVIAAVASAVLAVIIVMLELA